MIKVDTNTTHEINIIPREGTINKLVFTNEATRVDTELTVFTETINSNYITLGFDNTFEESAFYVLKVLDANDNVLYYDKVFCTDLEDYTINNNVYNPVVIEDKEYKIYKG